MSRAPPRSTRTYTLFPDTTLFRAVAVEGQVRPRALRRHAAARRPRARLRHRRRHPADGRALLGARPADPRPPAGRVAGAAAAPEEDHHLREPDRKSTRLNSSH